MIKDGDMFLCECGCNEPVVFRQNIIKDKPGWWIEISLRNGKIIEYDSIDTILYFGDIPLRMYIGNINDMKNNKLFDELHTLPNKKISEDFNLTLNESMEEYDETLKKLGDE